MHACMHAREGRQVGEACRQADNHRPGVSTSYVDEAGVVVCGVVNPSFSSTCQQRKRPTLITPGLSADIR